MKDQIPHIKGNGNVIGNSDSTINVIVGNITYFPMNSDDFRKMMEDAKKYQQFGEEIIEHAKKWEALHPKAKEALENCNYCPSQICP